MNKHPNYFLLENMDLDLQKSKLTFLEKIYLDLITIQLSGFRLNLSICHILRGHNKYLTTHFISRQARISLDK